MSMTEEELADMITTYRSATDAASGELRRGLVTGPAYRRFSADVGSPMSVRMLLDLLEVARAERDEARASIEELKATQGKPDTYSILLAEFIASRMHTEAEASVALDHDARMETCSAETIREDTDA